MHAVYHISAESNGRCNRSYTRENVVAIAVAISMESKMLAVAAAAVHERCCESIIDFGGGDTARSRRRSCQLIIDFGGKTPARIGYRF